MKKLLTFVLALSLLVSMAGLALAETYKIGASITPHGEVLNEAIKPLLAEKGIEIEVVEYTDYVQPNMATESDELAANYFQHKAYMDDFNAENGTHMVAAIAMHFEPMAIYPGKSLSLTEIKEGAQIAVPNDATNEARALLLLEANGLLKLKEGAGILATAADIEENPYNIKLVEMDAPGIPMRLADVDFAVINGNYALQAGLSSVTDSVAMENTETLNEAYFNYIVVKEGNEDGELVTAIREALQDESVRTYFQEKYQGAVLPAF